MSLTRKQWEEIWFSAKTIETLSGLDTILLKKREVLIRVEVNKIKKLVESVIGQME